MKENALYTTIISFPCGDNQTLAAVRGLYGAFFNLTKMYAPLGVKIEDRYVGWYTESHMYVTMTLASARDPNA